MIVSHEQRIFESVQNAHNLTLFTLHYTPGKGYSYHTLCLRDGAIAGGWYFKSADRARDVVTDAYKTPLEEVSETEFNARKRQRLDAERAVSA